MTLLDKRAIRITELSEQLTEAKGIITNFVWPADMDTQQHRKMLSHAAKFAGCAVPAWPKLETEESISNI